MGTGGRAGSRSRVSPGCKPVNSLCDSKLQLLQAATSIGRNQVLPTPRLPLLQFYCAISSHKPVPHGARQATCRTLLSCKVMIGAEPAALCKMRMGCFGVQALLLFWGNACPALQYGHTGTSRLSPTPHANKACHHWGLNKQLMRAIPLQALPQLDWGQAATRLWPSAFEWSGHQVDQHLAVCGM